jgi:hypothetical protein
MVRLGHSLGVLRLISPVTVFPPAVCGTVQNSWPEIPPEKTGRKLFSGAREQ